MAVFPSAFLVINPMPNCANYFCQGNNCHCYLLGSFTCFSRVGEWVGKGWNNKQLALLQRWANANIFFYVRPRYDERMLLAANCFSAKYVTFLKSEPSNTLRHTHKPLTRHVGDTVYTNKKCVPNSFTFFWDCWKRRGIGLDYFFT